MSKKPITIEGTFCDAPGCKNQVVEKGQRHCVVATDLTVFVYKKKPKERFAVKAAGAGDYCSMGCLLETIKKSVGEAQREDENLPYPDDGK